MKLTSPIAIEPRAINPVALGTALWRMGDALRATVFVKATFGMRHEQPARLLAPVRAIEADRYLTHPKASSLAEASEASPYLPGAAVLLQGHAYAKEGRAVTSMAACLSLFRGQTVLSKTVHVFGERTRATAGAPAPFLKMPLVYERAWGGAGVDENPIGTGVSPHGPLPNVILPSDPRIPAGFGPLSPSWGQRQRFLAATGGADLRGPVAELPRGFDFRYFHAAPMDQQLPALHGDEWIVLDGLHPERARFSTQLPGAKAHARWAPRSSQGQGFRPFSLLADTLIIEPDRGTCAVVWRGHFVIDEPECRNGILVLAGVELPDYPIAWPEGSGGEPAVVSLSDEDSTLDKHARVEASSSSREPLYGDDDEGSTMALDVEGELAARLRPVAPFLPAAGVAAGRAAVAPPRQVAKEADIESTLALGTSRPAIFEAPFAVTPAGTTSPAAPVVGAPWAGGAPPAPPPPIDPDDDSGTLALSALPPGIVLPPLVRAEAPQHNAPPEPPAFFAPPPPQAASVAPEVSRPSPEPVDSSVPNVTSAPAATDPASVLRATVLSRVRAKEGLGDLELSRADLSGIDFSGCSLSGLKLNGTVLRGCNLEKARLGGADLSGADLTGARLVGADLSGADLSRAVLVDCVLDGATVHHTNFGSAAAKGASLRGATGGNASFARGSWEGACFAKMQAIAADFTGSSLAGADFQEAAIADVRLTDARGEGVTFDGAEMTGAQAEGASLTESSFKRARAPRSNWEKAELTGSSFAHADLEGASLQRATCTGASFAHASLQGANLQRLTGDGADFSSARLNGSDLRQARARSARFFDTQMDGVVAGKADLSESQLSRVSLRGASLRAARLRGAQLDGVVLDDADLFDIDLHGASTQSVSATGAKMSGALKKKLLGSAGEGSDD